MASRFHIVALSVLMLAGTARAASPQLSTVLPRGAQRGTELDIQLVGQRLEDAKEVIVYQPGVTVSDVNAADPKKITAHVKIDGGARLGEYALRVRTASGISELVTFWVGPFPVVQEKEPNNEFDSPQKIDLNVTVDGVITGEDVDNYVVEAKRGQRLSVEIEGIRLGQTLFDPYVAILDENRFELAAVDDTALLKQDPFASVVVPKDGKYVIQVRESSFGGGGDAHYRMHVGTFPRPTAMYPCGGQAGQAVEVQYLGDVLGPIKTTLKLPDNGPEEQSFFVEHNGQTPPSPNYFRVCPFPNVMEVEPNNDPKTATATELTAPLALNGIISEKGDIDFFKFKAKKGESLEVNVYARRVHSPLDPVLTIYNAQGGQIASNDDSGGPDSYLRFNPPADGEYLLSVRDHLKQGGPEYVYRVELTHTRPSVTLAIPNNGGQPTQERQTIVVPRGNRFATMIRATRANVGGEEELSAKDLPQGVTMTAAPVAGEAGPVVFEAAADAPLAGKLFDLVSKQADDKNPVDGRFQQVVDLVVGNPGNTAYHKVRIDKMTAAVTEEAPFKIDIVEPKIPLVQNGALNLKVVAKRKEGFKGPISLRMMYNPPGVGSGASVDIPADKDEAYYPLNCGDGQPPRKWKIAILGTADVKGPLWVSTQMIDLEIAPPIVVGRLLMGTAEQGQTAQVACEIEQKTPLEGKFKAQLVGLPANVVCAEKEVGPGDTKIIFDVETTAKSPPGQHANLSCQITIKKNGEDIVQTVGRGGTLRIDAPIVKKTPSTKPVEVVKKPTTAPTKVLSRLEKLRLEQEGKQ